MRNVNGFELEMAAEVVNLDRSIVITGDSDKFAQSSQGIHTGTFGKSEEESVFDVRYAKVEHCGQRDVLGRYCFHFHLAGKCEKCILKVSHRMATWTLLLILLRHYCNEFSLHFTWR